MPVKGKVYLVGAGPGNVELLTLRGQKLVSQADVILYDALIDPAILKFARKNAIKEHCGKRGQDRHSIAQEEIHKRMLYYAQKGKTVVRLKGGDPFMFGRGAEEAEFLAAQGIDFEVVPGVSSITAAPVSAHIPLTDRRISGHVHIVTGHLSQGKNKMDWKYIRPNSTLVIVMGVSSLEKILQKLLRLKWNAKTPIACIMNACTSQQCVVEGTLNSLLKSIQADKNLVYAPALIVIGKVVSLRQKQC